MTEFRSERPARLVTTCVYLGMIGAFQVIQAVVVLMGWYSESGEEEVKRFTDPLVSDGVSRGDAETAFRVFLGLLALLAASVVVFAVYTALGHVVSRIMLTITAPIMALVALAQGSILSFVLSVLAFWFVFHLWNPEVRTWFARIEGKEQPAPAGAPGWPPPPPEGPAAGHLQTGAHPPAGQWAPPPQAYAYAGSPPPRAQDWVKVLSIITLVVSSLGALGTGLYLVMYEFAREELVQEQVDSGANWAHLTETEIREGMHDLALISWVMLPLCVVATCVSIVLLVRRRRRT